MLYILDMKLPDGNRISLCRKIRTAAGESGLFLSAYDNESYIVEGLEAGGDDYVGEAVSDTGAACTHQIPAEAFESNSADETRRHPERTYFCGSEQPHRVCE